VATQGAVGLEAILARSMARLRLPPPAICQTIRKRAILSQQEVADLLGVDQRSVSDWETGHCGPRGDAIVRYEALLRRLAKLANCTDLLVAEAEAPGDAARV